METMFTASKETNDLSAEFAAESLFDAGLETASEPQHRQVVEREIEQRKREENKQEQGKLKQEILSLRALLDQQEQQLQQLPPMRPGRRLTAHFQDILSTIQPPTANVDMVLGSSIVDSPLFEAYSELPSSTLKPFSRPEVNSF